MLALRPVSAVPPVFASFLIFFMPTRPAVNDIKSRSEERVHCLEVSILKELPLDAVLCNYLSVETDYFSESRAEIRLRFIQSAQIRKPRGTSSIKAPF